MTTYPEAEKLLHEMVAQKPDLISANIALGRIGYAERKKNEGDAEKNIGTHLQRE